MLHYFCAIGGLGAAGFLSGFVPARALGCSARLQVGQSTPGHSLHLASSFPGLQPCSQAWLGAAGRDLISCQCQDSPIHHGTPSQRSEEVTLPNKQGEVGGARRGRAQGIPGGFSRDLWLGQHPAEPLEAVCCHSGVGAARTNIPQCGDRSPSREPGQGHPQDADGAGVQPSSSPRDALGKEPGGCKQEWSKMC